MAEQGLGRASTSVRSFARTLVIMLGVNALGLMLFLASRSSNLISAVVDPLHADRPAMERAFVGYTLYSISLLALIAITTVLFVRWIVRSRSPRPSGRRVTAVLLACVVMVAVVVLAFIEVLLFQDYGIHLYEFDVAAILADAALRRDLGIQPAEVARVVSAALVLFACQVALFVAAARLSAWRGGALARSFGAAFAVSAPGGLLLFHDAEREIDGDRSEFVAALPLGRELLLRSADRPFIAVEPRPEALEPPLLARRPNIVFFVADGLRGDMVGDELTPNLAGFGTRPDVITSRQHFSTGHVSEAGIFGLTYGLWGHAFHSHVAARTPAFPVELLRRNGYATVFVASSRLSPYPTAHLLEMFDEVLYPRNDDEAVQLLASYRDRRAADGRPYFVLAFFYTPHYPFTSAKPEFRRYPMVGPKARSNYMNDVLQADDYFRQTLSLFDADYRAGRTIVLATADHGEEIRDHGVFGHASATFWNEKLVVPFFLGLPGANLASAPTPRISSHVDVWPTILDYLGASTRVDGLAGTSLMRPRSMPVLVTGRFFPHADRPSVLVDQRAKYWFRVDGTGANDRLCVVVTRVTDLDDRPLPPSSGSDSSMVAAFDWLQREFWQSVRASGRAASRERKIC